MKTGVIQSNYIPWRGYFDFIASVDLFVLYDCVQFTKNDWRNRNRIRISPTECKWLTIPVQPGKLAKRIDQTLVDSTRDWRRDHLNSFSQNYRRAPHLDSALNLFEKSLSHDSIFLSQINEHALREVCNFLGITTRIVRSAAYDLTGDRNERLMNLLLKIGTKTYLSGPGADVYLDRAMFAREGIDLEYKRYDYPTYPQVHGGFEPAVTVFDLIANVGPGARDFMRTQTPDKKMI